MCVTGQSYNNMVTKIMPMGHEGQQMIAALRVCSNYPDRVVVPLSVEILEIEKVRLWLIPSSAASTRSGSSVFSGCSCSNPTTSSGEDHLNSYGSASVSTDETNDSTESFSMPLALRQEAKNILNSCSRLAKPRNI